MNVEIPEQLRAFVTEQAAKDGFESAEAYIVSLICDARDRHAEDGKQCQEDDLRTLGLSQEELDEKLLEGVQSGPVEEMTAKDWEDIRREGLRKLANRAVP